MKEFLDALFSGQYVSQDVLVIAGGAAALLVFLKLMVGLFRRKRDNPHVQFADCVNCGWEGEVSRYAGRCPQCNQALGDQKARRRA